MSTPSEPANEVLLGSADKQKAAADDARADRDARLAAIADASPWLDLREASAYAKRGRRVLRKAVTDGRLRAAILGTRKKLIFRRDWLDAYLCDLATPVLLARRHG
jgi:hypothetical protein